VTVTAARVAGRYRVPVDGTVLPLRTLVSSVWADVGEPGLLVVRDAGTWADLWRRLSGDEGDPPAVDWTTEMVVLVALGMRPSGGYAVEVEAVSAIDGGIEVRTRETAPGPSCFTTGAITYPVHAVAVAAHDGEPRLVQRVEVVDCE
jgi:hypothetical protein